MGVVLRPARPDDAQAIARVQVAAWRSTYRGLVPDEFLDNMEEDPEKWLNAIRRDDGTAQASFVIVAEDASGGVIGYAAAGRERTGDPRYKGELHAIYILEERQRQGIGKRLVRAAAQGLLKRGHSSMLVWVLAENPFRRFYESLGGRRLRNGTVAIADAEFEMWAYGWDDVRRLAEAGGDGH